MNVIRLWYVASGSSVWNPIGPEIPKMNLVMIFLIFELRNHNNRLDFLNQNLNQQLATSTRFFSINIDFSTPCCAFDESFVCITDDGKYGSAAAPLVFWPLFILCNKNYPTTKSDVFLTLFILTLFAN